MTKNIRLRIDIRIQNSSGSVDEKFPYLYINAATAHSDNVLIILDGKGYKRLAKKWLRDVILSKWLIVNDKKIYLHNIVNSIEFLKRMFN